MRVILLQHQVFSGDFKPTQYFLIVNISIIPTFRHRKVNSVMSDLMASHIPSKRTICMSALHMTVFH